VALRTEDRCEDGGLLAVDCCGPFVLPDDDAVDGMGVHRFE
jgi:hypothetical protein